ncbi:hypothetical protein OL239_04395 [Arthrobacter sp. ATA002]|uniref:hypothetical protein n=1 Tax=Arthrobacter sp. ATA002 TaxID=2991715 RepID=UPI0022A76C7B|nr:hypothetical protein [Arthrobacter sp. ATA002]WAP52498.1 hypothetical protein OL239_04395 [Arthrobacter sp. ATA002]
MAVSRHRRTHLGKLRIAAAGSVLAAVSITGVGAAAAPASAADLRSFLAPLDRPGEAAGSLAGTGRTPKPPAKDGCWESVKIWRTPSPGDP